MASVIEALEARVLLAGDLWTAGSLVRLIASDNGAPSSVSVIHSARTLVGSPLPAVHKHHHYPISAPVASPPVTGPVAPQPPVPQPAATLDQPIILSTTSGTRAHTIAITWANVSGATGYAIERSFDGVNWTQVGATAAGATNFLDEGLAENTAYYYRVRAFNDTASATSDPRVAQTAPFAAFDATFFSGEPKPVAANIPLIYVAYGGFIDSNGNPDEAGARAIARAAFDSGQMLVFDIETFPIDLTVSPIVQVNQTIAKYHQLLDWVRSERPGLKVGFYQDLPRATSAYANDYLLRGLGPLVDFISPSLYTDKDDPTAWLNGMMSQLNAAEPYHKPIYPFVTPTFATPGPPTPLPVDFWRLELAEIRQRADGIILWGGGTPWDPAAPWWQATQDLLAQSPQIPAAPVVSLTPLGAQLSWNDPGGGENGFWIERSTDGVNFSLIGSTQRGLTQWADSQLIGGADLYYRVKAIGAFGDSAWSNIVHGVVSRSALGIIQAEGYDFGPNVSREGTNVGHIDDGDVIEYRSVDFGSGANQFVANIGVAAGNAYQRLDVRLDGASGPLVGTLTISPTDSFVVMARQSIAITPTTGLHDVYLVFRGTADGTVNSGAGLLDWIAFAQNSAPAAPINLIVNSAGSHVDLAWTITCTDETGFVVERSTDGTNFAPLATTAAATSSYSDNSVSVGVRYYYRVHAVNSYGASAPTNIDDGIGGLRNAFSQIDATSFDAGSGVRALNGTLGNIDNGGVDWAAWYDVDFGSGARTFTASLGLPFGAEGQPLDLHLDDLSGPLIGSLVTEATGNFYTYQLESTALTNVVGVHDLYIVFNGTAGMANIEWFRFSP